jgi:hypothetical protein
LRAKFRRDVGALLGNGGEEEGRPVFKGRAKNRRACRRKGGKTCPERTREESRDTAGVAFASRKEAADDKRLERLKVGKQRDNVCGRAASSGWRGGRLGVFFAIFFFLASGDARRYNGRRNEPRTSTFGDDGRRRQNVASGFKTARREKRREVNFFIANS